MDVSQITRFILAALGVAALLIPSASVADDTVDMEIKLFVKKGDKNSSVVRRLLKERAQGGGILIREYDLASADGAKALNAIAKKHGVDVANKPAPFVAGCDRLIWGYGDNFSGLLTEMLRVDVFVSDKCADCDDARKLVGGPFRKRYPAFTVRVLNVSESTIARDWLRENAEMTKQKNSVPAFYLCGQLHVGWDGVDGTDGSLKKIAHKWSSTPADRN